MTNTFVTIENIPAFIREYMERMWTMLELRPLPDIPDTLLCAALQKYLLPYKERIDRRDFTLLDELKNTALFADFDIDALSPEKEDKTWRYLELFCTVLGQ